MRAGFKFGNPGSVVLRKDAFLDEEIYGERRTDEDDRREAAQNEPDQPPPARRARNNDGRQFIRP